LVNELEIPHSDVHVPWDTNNNTVRGFAYINSSDEDAVYKLHEYELQGRVLRVQEAKSRDGQDSGKTFSNSNSRDTGASDTVKLNQVNPDLNEQDLRKFFGKCGSIKRVFKPDGKNFAYVGFDNPKDAEKAIAMDMSTLGDDVRPEMDVKKPQGGGGGGGRGGGFGGGRGGGRGGGFGGGRGGGSGGFKKEESIKFD